MLWDVIRDFFVMYIFGGTNSQYESFSGFIGTLISSTSDYNTDYADTRNFYVTLNGFVNDFDYSFNDVSLSIGDWLSTTFTIITLILICYMFLRLTIWLFKFGAGLFKW